MSKKEPYTGLVRLQLSMIREATDIPLPRKITTPADASQYADSLRDYDREAFGVIMLSSRNTVIGLHIASIGVLDATLISPGSVFKTALMANAGAVVLCHNHPSGDTTPSAEDIRITRTLVEAGKLIDLKVIDHVIVGPPNKWVSLREEGLINFN